MAREAALARVGEQDWAREVRNIEDIVKKEEIREKTTYNKLLQLRRTLLKIFFNPKKAPEDLTAEQRKKVFNIIYEMYKLLKILAEFELKQGKNEEQFLKILFDNFEADRVGKHLLKNVEEMSREAKEVFVDFKKYYQYWESVHKNNDELPSGVIAKFFGSAHCNNQGIVDTIDGILRGEMKVVKRLWVLMSLIEKKMHEANVPVNA